MKLLAFVTKRPSYNSLTWYKLQEIAFFFLKGIFHSDLILWNKFRIITCWKSNTNKWKTHYRMFGGNNWLFYFLKVEFEGKQQTSWIVKQVLCYPSEETYLCWKVSESKCKEYNCSSRLLKMRSGDQRLSETR